MKLFADVGKTLEFRIGLRVDLNQVQVKEMHVNALPPENRSNVEQIEWRRDVDS